MDAETCTAVVDESFRRQPEGGCYLLTAVMVPDAVIVEITRHLRETLPPGQRRWHWRDERPGSRRRFLDAVASFVPPQVAAVTYWQSVPSQRKGEQARVRCLWRLLAGMPTFDAATVVLESRQEHNDRKDRREVGNAQRAGLVPSSLVYRHDRPKDEPLLWLPDAVAGAAGVSIIDADRTMLELLPAPMRQIVEVGDT